MSFSYFYLIIVFLSPSVIHSKDRDVDHDKDLYFEIVEPLDISYTFRCRPAKGFGTKFDRLLQNIYLIPTKPLKACSGLQNKFESNGNIVLVERGDCSFVTKVINVQDSGALAVIVMDNDPTADNLFVDMVDDLTKRNVRIPAMFLHYRDGHMILNSIEQNHLIGVRINIPLNLTYNEMLKVHRAPGSHWL